jgi:hypothetical protein
MTRGKVLTAIAILVVGASMLAPQAVHAGCPTCPAPPGGEGKKKRPTPTTAVVPADSSAPLEVLPLPTNVPTLALKGATILQDTATPSATPTETAAGPGTLQNLGMSQYNPVTQPAPSSGWPVPLIIVGGLLGLLGVGSVIWFVFRGRIAEGLPQEPYRNIGTIDGESGRGAKTKGGRPAK